MKNDNMKMFKITSVCRNDLLNAGFKQKQIDKLDDGDMEYIASEMAEAYCNEGFWTDLQIITDLLFEEKKGRK
jgi:hypothetical protein